VIKNPQRRSVSLRRITAETRRPRRGGHYGLLRPQRQNCGVLFGASFINRNDYARFIALKIVLENPIDYTGDPEYLIPPASEDGFLARLIEFADHNELQLICPWVYDASTAE
jgi:hypothetical protein